MLLQQFKESVQGHFQKVAVVDSNRSLTYGDLDQYSNGIAQVLIARSVGKGSRVGILGPRSTDYVVAILGALKAGACYVPLDPYYPSERLSYMISASNIDTVLADRSCSALVTHLHKKEAFKNLFFFDQVKPSDTEILSPIGPDDAIVILFTSGSTGNPKGVELSYAGYANNFQNMQALLEINSHTHMAQMASPCFDISVTELLMPLLHAATIFIADDEIKKNPWLLAEWIFEHQIDTIQFVPSLFQHLLLAHEDSPIIFTSIKKLVPEFCYRRLSRLQSVRPCGGFH
jgi:non-ribosomal peptide synthetase component F